MTLKYLLCIGATLLLVTGCKEDKATETTPPAKVEAKTAKKKIREEKRFFVCQVANDKLALLSTLVDAPASTSDQTMAEDFMKTVKSLDRTYFPLMDDMVASCESSTDQLLMANRALDVREEVVAEGKSFRSVTAWKP